MATTTFSMRVRKEAAMLISQKTHCRLAELAGLIYTGGEVSFKEISFVSDNKDVAKKVFTLFRKNYKMIPDVTVSGHGRSRHIKISLGAEKTLQAVLKDLAPDDELPGGGILKKNCCKRAFIRGCFLAGGSVTDPSKGYHLEIVVPCEKLAEKICDLVGSFFDDDLGEVKFTLRKRHDGSEVYVVYIKDSDRISDFLNMTECYRSLMDMENIRVEKEIANSVNRRLNCEMANLVKTISAAQEQKNDTEIIEEFLGIDNLPLPLRQLAKLRKEDTEMTIKQLGEALDPPVSKSCVNHRLRKLKKIADELRAQQ
jgi:DNA-binding protein WhiA